MALRTTWCQLCLFFVDYAYVHVLVKVSLLLGTNDHDVFFLSEDVFYSFQVVLYPIMIESYAFVIEKV